MLVDATPLQRIWAALHRRRLMLTCAAMILVTALAASWMVRLATMPTRQAGPRVMLDAHDLPGIEVRVYYPSRLESSRDGPRVVPLTVTARALTPGAVQSFDLLLPLPDEAAIFVDRDGLPVEGRLAIRPGYPHAVPHNLLVAHGQTGLSSRPLWPHRVRVTPVISLGDQLIPAPELAFDLDLPSQWEQAAREFSLGFSRAGLLYLFLTVLLAAIAWAWHLAGRRHYLARQRELAATYGRLREEIRLERWAQARELIEQLRQAQPNYRDLDQLETEVSAAETAGWRREQLYQHGVDAYRRRDWPTAVQSFIAVERESPYYRDVRFLRRTAELYADLQSRDRSLRVAAAQELGQVADLVDVAPLLQALGDRSDAVADAAVEALRQIGLDALDALIGALATDDARVRQRVYRLIEGLGQAAREPLLGALRSSDRRISGAAARLLAGLGCREELANALLLAPTTHLEGIVQALLGEGLAAAAPLIDALLEAPPERRPVVLNALAALKAEVEIDRRLEEALRATRNARQRELLQQAQRMAPGGFYVPDEPEPNDRSLPSGQDAEAAEGRTSGGRRIRLFGRREP